MQAQLKASKVAERQLLEDVVEDSKRAETFGLLLDERDTIVSVYADVVADYIASMRALNSDYDATAEDFERLITDYRSARQSYQQDLISVIQRMKATTNEKEWKRLAKFQLQELNPRETAPSKGGV